MGLATKLDYASKLHVAVFCAAVAFVGAIVAGVF
jgi:hypothetical protein